MSDDAELLDDIDSDKPKTEPKSARAWLALIDAAEKQIRPWQDKSDSIERQYANLEKLASTTRDREFQLFWANVQVLGPSIYSRPPIPVVVPRFKDRKPLPRTASELLERATLVAFEQEDLDASMMLCRDDLNIVGRGALWVRYETKSESESLTERVCVEHVDRKDILTDPARKWKEVDWVAKRSWLTKAQARKRFGKNSEKAYQDLAFAKLKNEDGADDGRLKAAIWEIWCKSQNKVVWVGEGSEKVLDEGEPHLKLEGFFPCPRPAYATLQPRSLIPVPDYTFYKDQIEEINETTSRISALTEAIKVRGFYPAGAGEISDAIEAALRSTDERAMIVPVANWALMGAGAKDMIVYWPIGDIATVVVQLIEIRKQLIEDVYQIMGLSDIMRGSTEASETLGAQQLKSQYGSVRIRDKQSELVRIARDTTRIVAEIMAENFQSKTLLDMSQLELPTDAEISKQVKAIEGQAKQIQAEAQQAQTDPEMQAMAQKVPEQAQQIMQQAQEQLQQLGQQAGKIKETVTIDQVMKFLRDQRIRPFVLDIETDSTIAPDENAQKERATEFVTAIGGAMNQAAPLLQMMPQAGPLLAETLKYLSSQFRAGRQLEQEIDTFADGLKQMAGQPKPPDPEQAKAEADAKAAQTSQQIEAAKAQQDIKAKEAETAAKQQDAQLSAAERAQALQAKQAAEEHTATLRQQDVSLKDQEAVIKRQALSDAATMAAQKHGQDMELGALAIQKLQLEIGRVQVQTDATIATTSANIEATEAKTESGINAQQAGVEMKREMAEASSGDE